MAKKPDDLVVPEGHRWDHCKGRVVLIEKPHKVIIVDTGWPEVHLSSERGR